jgi:predicted kinase
VIDLDDLRGSLGVGPTDNQGTVIAQAIDKARDFLRAEQPFAWNATNLSRQMRAPLIDLFVGYGARVRLIYLEVPWSEILQRNRTRAAAVPVAALQKMANRLEVPTVTEAHQVEWYVMA